MTNTTISKIWQYIEDVPAFLDLHNYSVVHSLVSYAGLLYNFMLHAVAAVVFKFLTVSSSRNGQWQDIVHSACWVGWYLIIFVQTVLCCSVFQLIVTCWTSNNECTFRFSVESSSRRSAFATFTSRASQAWDLSETGYFQERRWPCHCCKFEIVFYAADDSVAQGKVG